VNSLQEMVLGSVSHKVWKEWIVVSYSEIKEKEWKDNKLLFSFLEYVLEMKYGYLKWRDFCPSQFTYVVFIIWKIRG